MPPLPYSILTIRRTKMSKKVFVACKLPNGHWLHIHNLVEDPSNPKAKLAQQVDKVLLRGTNSPDAFLVGDYGITPVDADFWDAWISVHESSPLVKNGLIFAQTTERSTRAEAAKREGILSGFEPVDPDKPGEDLEPTDDQKRENSKARSKGDPRHRENPNEE